MECVIIKQKPDEISWDELAECQQKAHVSNKAMGVNMACADYSGEQLRTSAEKGTTLVALNDVGHVVGMLSFIYKNNKWWWYEGIAAYVCFVAVSPEYKGKGVYRSLREYAEKMMLTQGVAVEYLQTHANNSIAIGTYLRDGYRKVRFSPGSGKDYYSIEMAKWLIGRGKSRLLCAIMFNASRIVVKLLYKPGKINRFSVNKRKQTDDTV